MAKNTGKDNDAEMPDWAKNDEGEKVQTQFPPFLKIQEGAMCVAKLIDFDDEDPEFKRFVLQALAPVKCHRGPIDAGEDVVVKAGELFTISDFATLRIHRLIGYEMKIRVTGKITANTPAGFVWGFDVTLSPESAKQLNARKQSMALPSGG